MHLVNPRLHLTFQNGCFRNNFIFLENNIIECMWLTVCCAIHTLFKDISSCYEFRVLLTSANNKNLNFGIDRLYLKRLLWWAGKTIKIGVKTITECSNHKIWKCSKNQTSCVRGVNKSRKNAMCGVEWSGGVSGQIGECFSLRSANSQESSIKEGLFCISMV